MNIKFGVDMPNGECNGGGKVTKLIILISFENSKRGSGVATIGHPKVVGSNQPCPLQNLFFYFKR